MADVEITVRGSHDSKASPGRAKVRVRAMSAPAPDVELAPQPISVTAEVDARFLAS